MTSNEEHHKDFDGWNEMKKGLHAGEVGPHYKTREIWWCSIGTNIGHEQDGTGDNYDRPIVVLRGFNRRIFLAVVLIGKRKTGYYYYPVGKVNDRQASAVLSQVRLLDSKRLVRKIGMLEKERFATLQERTAKVVFERELGSK